MWTESHRPQGCRCDATRRLGPSNNEPGLRLCLPLCCRTPARRAESLLCCGKEWCRFKSLAFAGRKTMPTEVPHDKNNIHLNTLVNDVRSCKGPDSRAGDRTLTSDWLRGIPASATAMDGGVCTSSHAALQYKLLAFSVPVNTTG